MAKMTTTRTQELMRSDRDELVAQIARVLPKVGTAEPQPGLSFARLTSPSQPFHSVLEPSFCVIAQGAKEVLLGDERFRYDPAHYLITTMDLPTTVRVVEASPQRPYLSLRLLLDPAIVTPMMVEAGAVESRAEAVKGLDVSPLDPDLMNAILRLVRLVGRPSEYRVLAPLITREIVYYINVAGRPVTHILSIFRQFRNRYVGTETLTLPSLTGGPDKHFTFSKPALVVYDWLKLPDQSLLKGNTSEHQALGFQASAIKDAAGKLDLAVIAGCQGNRESLKATEEEWESAGEAFVAGSDRFRKLKKRAAPRTEPPRVFAAQRRRNPSDGHDL
jgi:hypothetical protein